MTDLQITICDPQTSDNERMLLARIAKAIKGRLSASGTLLASAARTANTSTSTLSWDGFRDVVILMNVSLAGAAGGLQFSVEYQDPITSSWVRYGFNQTAITTTGQRMFIIGKALAVGTNVTVNGGTSSLLPCPLNGSMRITIVHSTADSYTYSLAYIAT